MADSGATPAEVGVGSGGISSAENGDVASLDKTRQAKVTKDTSPGVSGVLKRKKPSVRPPPRPLKRKMTDIGETHENGGVVSPGHVASAEVMDDDQFSVKVAEDTSANCNCHLCRNFSSMRSVFRQEIASRDVLLQKLEESVTRMAEELSFSNKCVKKIMQVMDIEISHSEASAEGTPLEGDMETEEQEKIFVRNRYIESIMSVTEILENNEEKTSQVKGWYEKIYDTAPETSYILRILEKHRKLKIFIDCDSYHIGRMTESVADHDGNKRLGAEFHAFADLMEFNIYSAGKQKTWYADVSCNASYSHPSAALAECFTQIAMRVIFRNKGCPYARGDKLMEKVYERIVSEAMSEKNAVKKCSYSFQRAHGTKTQIGREVMLISAIPAYIVQYGLGSVMSRPDGPLNFLYLFFKQHVVPKMMDYLLE